MFSAGWAKIYSRTRRKARGGRPPRAGTWTSPLSTTSPEPAKIIPGGGFISFVSWPARESMVTLFVAALFAPQTYDRQDSPAPHYMDLDRQIAKFGLKPPKSTVHGLRFGDQIGTRPRACFARHFGPGPRM